MTPSVLSLKIKVALAICCVNHSERCLIIIPFDAVIVSHNLSVGLLNGVFIHRSSHVVLEINNEIIQH